MRIIRILFNLYRKNLGYGVGWNLNLSGELIVINKLFKYYIDKGLTNITVFDVGANNGLWSKAINSVFNDDLELHCFEPQSKCYSLLLTLFDKSVKINKFALGSQKGNIKLYSNRQGSEIASIYKQDIYSNTSKSMLVEEIIHIDTLDNYCVENNINKIHFLKLDVEGHELDVLKGGKIMLEKTHIDFIQFEFGVPNLYSRTLINDFFNFLGSEFVIFRISKNRLHPIESYNPELEVFLTTNYLCVNKTITADFKG